MPKNTPRRTDRKLVLGRETVRALTRPRTLVDQTIVADETSCGEVCTCACDTQTY